ncbi:flavin reductase family protein [Paracandidimonas soli]|uniref:Flavin reductase (DIM6/NTAB) family NADH-FMN oxidoreductase RutF n=1 Tax=Paracandidimonas soli TaxID=1917182 RepID=A0A4R3UTS2_9BURK|nr:flavin reductase family protein [Paracandidimonas soli]TCU94502.1 flavin reductase (DIM6/NTAB) family NADH-FMN oxidoreductase RutF [Paracandidimonas soli]
MFFDFHALDSRDTYKLMASTVVPRPIAWVVTLKENGKLNAAPFSFFNVLSGEPPVIGLGIGRHGADKKDTSLNIERTGEFVVNLVPAPLAEAMNVTAAEYPYDVDEIDVAGLQTLPSRKVKPPRIAGSPVALECRLWKEIDVDGLRTIYLARVEGVHVDDGAVLDAQRCHIDALKLDAIGRLHGADWYVKTSDNFRMPRRKPDTPRG